MSYTIDQDEIKLIPQDNKWFFEYRFCGTQLRITDGHKYDSMKECLSLAMMNMALSTRGEKQPPILVR